MQSFCRAASFAIQLLTLKLHARYAGKHDEGYCRHRGLPILVAARSTGY